MKNKEKFKDEIVDIVCDGDALAIDMDTYKPVACRSISCGKCLIYSEEVVCSSALSEWANQEYKEPIVMSFNDNFFINYIKDDVEYIARDKNGYLYAFLNKPKKYEESGKWIGEVVLYLYRFNITLPMIKWEDNQPWKISDLKKLKVVKNY